MENKKNFKDNFRIITLNQERTKFTIVLGNNVVTEKEFQTYEEAEKYIETPQWDMIAAVVVLLSEKK